MNILIIDDEELVLRTLTRYIQHRGDTPFSASDSRMGLRLLDDNPIELVITDIRMPDLDGFDVLQHIRDHRPEVPVIIITAFANTDTAIQAVNNGAFAFLQKPVLADELSAKIDEAEHYLLQRLQQHAKIEDLEKTAAQQRRRLQREQAFSTAILRNIPFPVCLVDHQGIIQLVNAAFRQHCVRKGDAVEGQLLPTLLEGLDLSPFGPHEVFTRFQGTETSPGITIEIPDLNTAGGKRNIRYFYVTGFAVESPDSVVESGLTCLFLQDHTLRLQLENEQKLRNWCTQKIYEFREKTASLIHSLDLLDEITVHLATMVEHFNPVRVCLSYNDNQYTAGQPCDADYPYLSETFIIEEGRQGQLELFSSAPADIELQRDFINKLSEILVRRIEAREFEMRLLQTSQLRALGEMSAGVAHELNQPLSGIRTFAESILYGIKHGWELEEGELNQILGDIIGQVDRMTTIIDHMRTFSRAYSEEDPIPFQIDAVIADVFKVVDSQLKVHGIAVDVQVPDNLPVCKGWPQQIEQVMLNLIVNSRQAMDEYQRKIAAEEIITAANWRPTLTIATDIHPDQDTLWIHISDTGGGIPESISGRVFEPFFTSKEVGEGTGLGLSISRSIVQRHDGTLELDNRPGVGVTAKIVLPIHIETT